MPQKPKQLGGRMVAVRFNCPETWIPDIPAMLQTLADKHTPVKFPVCLTSLLADLEWRYIDCALAQTGGNVQEAADLLGMNRTTLAEKLRRAGRTGKTK